MKCLESGNKNSESSARKKAARGIRYSLLRSIIVYRLSSFRKPRIFSPALDDRPDSEATYNRQSHRQYT